MALRAGTTQPESTRPRAIRWPVRLLGPPPGLKEINVACWGALAAFLILKVGVPLWQQFETGVHSLHILPADFIYFYGIGTIAGHYPLARLYDYNLQLKTFNAIYLLHDGAYGPSPYPPFVALFFSVFARLKFELAFALWAVASVAMYLAGIGAVLKRMFPLQALKVSLVVCLALAFYPFLIGTLANGQLTAVAVCAVGLAFARERDAKPFESGLFLSLLAYKPTLLLLLVPMLILTRRFRALAGFFAGACILGLAATVLGGVSIWPAYLRFVTMFGKVAALGDRSGLPLAKFVDLASCLHAIAGARSAAGTVALALAAGIVVIALAVFWWKSARAGKAQQALVWAATLTWTLLINVYVPIYDSALVVLAVLLTIGALEELEWGTAASLTVSLAILIEVASWFTSRMATEHGVQILSIAILLLGLAQLLFLYRAVNETSPRAAGALAQAG